MGVVGGTSSIEEYDPYLHLIQPFPIPTGWARYVVVDFGSTNAFCAQWWAVDHDGRLYRYRELYGVRRKTRNWAHLIYEHSGGEKIGVVITDHDLEERRTLEAAWGTALMGARSPRSSTTRTSPIPPDRVGHGRHRAARTCRRHREGRGPARPARDGKPRLFLMRDALVFRDPLLEAAHLPCCTEEEFPSYEWAKAKSLRFGQVLLKKPIDEGDHGLDCVRYMTMHLDGPQRALYEMMGTSVPVRVGR